MPTLTEQQRRAVEDRGGRLLVSAAAGSGKTKVLVERLFSYVTEEGRHLDDFLIITYTKAAAAELRSKIAAELSDRLGRDPDDLHLKEQLLRVYQADIKTVDAFCTALLREHIHLLARKEEEGPCLPPDFRVLDEQDAQLLRQRVLDRVLEGFYKDLDPGGAALADTLGAGRDDSALEALVLECYEKLQSHARPDRWLSAQTRLWRALETEGASAARERPEGPPEEPFDTTPYAQALLTGIRRKARHLRQQLAQAGAHTKAGPLEEGYGQRFAAVAEALAPLARAEAWEEARQALSLVAFPRLSTPRGMKDDPAVLRLKQLWDAAKESCRRLGALLAVSGREAMEDLSAMAPAMIALLDLTGRFSQAYREEKRRRGCADFSDQEHLALSLLTEEDGAPTALGCQIARRYREVLVDEYQDANEIQNALFHALSQEGAHLFTVGDVKQSIYRFRLADPGIFLERFRRFAPAEQARPGQPRKIVLSQNFRSRREILEAANFVFSAILSPQMGEMAYGEEEALHFGAAAYPPREDCRTEFHLICAHSRSAEHAAPVKKTAAEARFTARRIRQLLEEGFPVTGEDGALRPCRPEDIVILMRSPGSRSEAFVQALSQEGVPCAQDRSGGFFETMEVSVALALLEIVDNPRQDVHLITALRSPVFGFTADRLAQVRSCDPAGEMYDALRADPGEDARTFLSTLSALRQAASDMTAGRFLWHLYDVLALPAVFAAMDGGRERQENLLALGRYVQDFDAAGGRGIFAFLSRLRQWLAAGKPPEIRVGGGGAGVGIMSIHRSKGLEFPIVFLCDLDRAFSRRDLDAAVLVHPTLGLGPRCVDLKRRIRYPTMARQAVEELLRREDLAEEQRILYVAMTRPREKLILVDAAYHVPTRLERLCAVAAAPMSPEAVAEGKCLGDWLLPVLLCRPEAGALREMAGGEIPALAPPSDCPWLVAVHDAQDFARAAIPAAASETPEAGFDREVLTFAYPYQYQSRLPAKRTATDWKGRPWDDWAQENAAHPPRLRPLRQPAFRRKGALTAAERGSLMHQILQHLDFGGGDAAGQIDALCREGRLRPEAAAWADIPALDRFLASPLAREIAASKVSEREYCFTVLLPARDYDPQAVGEDEILLQGVVDCWFETPEGIAVVDFKTDDVEDAAALARRAEGYFSQLRAYSLALERVLERPVVRRVLCFLHLGQTVEVPPA